MGEIFGAVFYSQYGAVGDGGRQTWKDGLSGYSEEQIGRGLKNCLAWNQAFPPNLSQFAALCLQTRPEEKQNFTEARMARGEESSSPLAHLKKFANSDVAKRELERMRRIMAGQEVETFEQSYHGLQLGRRWPGALTPR